MQLRTPKRLILIAALSLATPACLDTNNSPAPVDMASDLGPTDQGGDTPVDTDMGDMAVDMPVDMGPCGGACADGKVCDPSDGQCVGCLDASQCGGDTPACDPTTRACVGCVDVSDCTGDVCDPTTNTCVQCVNDDTCNGATPRCEVGSNACVACLDHPDCPGADAAQCSGNSCAPCSDNAHCAHLADTPLCDAGTCVQCTVATEDTDCVRTVEGESKVFSCDPATKTCSDVEKGTLGTCQPCSADSQCIGAQFCVPMRFTGGGQDVDAGAFCLPKLDGAGKCPDWIYKTVLSDRMSLSGATGPFCGVLESRTTCPAVNTFLAAPKITCTDDSRCGLGGHCNTVLGEGRICTYLCSQDSECPNEAIKCANGGSLDGKYCGGP